MDRRTFVKTISAAGIITTATPSTSVTQAPPIRERHADLLIVGGGLGGCSAALAALRNGLQVIMTEETNWIGGQLTQQAVPPDEHSAIETYGAPKSYREFRTKIRDYYRRNYPLTEQSRQKANLNPGSGNVSRLCHEPRVALAVLHELFAPFLSGKHLTLLHHHHVINTSVTGDKITSVQLFNEETGNALTVSAPYFIDATEMGDLLPLTETEYVTGFESQKETGEMHAPNKAQPQNMQACTWVFAMDHIPGANNTIPKPKDYAFWKAYIPTLNPAWPGPLLDWAYSNPVTLQPRTLLCDPEQESRGDYSGFWRYRRIAHQQNFVPGAYPSDITIVNWPQNDYLLGNLFEVPGNDAKRHCEQAKQLSLSLFYWMQTEAPRLDGGTGNPGLRLRGDITGTEDGLAKYPYIRESRRIKAEFTVVEHHIGLEARMAETGLSKDDVKAEQFDDSVGVGSYRLDLHPSTGGDNYIDIESLRFQIPLGALIPQRIENLLPACKNLGVTHITNGCYRLHPVEWGIGEAAGTLVAHCLHTQETPRGVRNTQKKREAFQHRLESQGVELAWPIG